jgi:hypothetical protein
MLQEVHRSCMPFRRAVKLSKIVSYEPEHEHEVTMAAAVCRARESHSRS